MLPLLVAASEWLARRSGFRHLGSALIVILLGALAANLRLIPAGSLPGAPVPLYDAIFEIVAPVGIFWLLLAVNLRDLLRAGLPLVLLFLVGSIGTAAGAIAGMRLVDGASTIGPLYDGVAGMFAGTYIGGSVNFNAIAVEYGVVREGGLYAGAIVVDNIATAIWMAVTLAVPRLLVSAWPTGRRAAPTAAAARAPIVDLPAETEALNPSSLSAAVALGIGALLVSQRLSAALAVVGWNVPPILTITTLALVLAQFPGVNRLSGPRLLGMVAVYLFLAVVGAFCDLGALGAMGRLGIVLLVFALLTVLVHGIVTFGVAWLFRADLAGAAIASNANVGGSTSALALAKSLGREDLLLPAILLGSLGNAIGTFAGFLVARLV
jgi:uncharacterized membrane protein